MTKVDRKNLSKERNSLYDRTERKNSLLSAENAADAAAAKSEIPEVKIVSRTPQQPRKIEAVTPPSISEAAPTHITGDTYYRPTRKKSKAPLIAVIIIILCLIAIYCVGVFVIWKDRFLPNTFINSQSVAHKTSEEVVTELLPQNTDYIFKTLDGEESMPLSDFDYDVSFNESIDSLIESQNHYLWPLSFIKKTEFDNAVNVTYDSEKLENRVKSSDLFNEKVVTKPQDAHLDKGEDGHYAIIPEVMGNQLDYDKTISLVKDGLSDCSYDIDLVKEDCYLKPAVYSDDKELAADLKYAQSIGEETITIDLTGETLVLEPFDLKDLVKADGDELVVDEDALMAFVNDLADKYNTYLTERPFTTHNGEKITVGGNHTKEYGIDTYGFLMNKFDTTNDLRACLLSKTDQTMQPSWDVIALTRNQENGDIGDTYIEISLTEQHLWFYKKGKLVYDDDVVTGLDTDLRRTPWGLFRAYGKEKDARLRGELAGDKWDTKVGFWISVDWSGVGIHDATWQPVFGGDWYKTNGSHGCINVTYDTGKYLYENVDLDTPIAIY